MQHRAQLDDRLLKGCPERPPTSRPRCAQFMRPVCTIAALPPLLVCWRACAGSGELEVRREGQAGGFKELDEAEVEEARKRRKEFESKDMWVEGVALRVCACLLACLLACVCVCACVCVRACMREYVRVHVCVRAILCVCCVCVLACARADVNVCVHMYVCSRTPMCTFAW